VSQEWITATAWQAKRMIAMGFPSKSLINIHAATAQDNSNRFASKQTSAPVSTKIAF